jgi:MurNAc alpha-1-phosphate uridylyltransferase
MTSMPQPPDTPPMTLVTGSHKPPLTPPAIVLAAGRGERMRPLTDTCPKPLLAVQGQPLLMWHVRALLQGGCRHMVVNTAWLGNKINDFFGTYRLTVNNSLLYSMDSSETSAFQLAFSDEQADFGAALETAGGIARALPMLTPGGTAPDAVFWVVAGDVFVPGFRFSQHSVDRFRASTHLAHLWLVPNPPHNPRGDFGLSADGLALNVPPTASPENDTPRYTYSTIGLYRAELFAAPWCDIPPGNPHGVKAPLAPLLRRAMDAGRVSAELYSGPWTDVGTPERLAELNTF